MRLNGSATLRSAELRRYRPSNGGELRAGVVERRSSDHRGVMIGAADAAFLSGGALNVCAELKCGAPRRAVA